MNMGIDWYGFKGLVSHSLSRHLGYHINPKRMHGSAVETIFSQLKFITSGQLTWIRHCRHISVIMNRATTVSSSSSVSTGASSIGHGTPLGATFTSCTQFL